jgi:hypothetical protein
MPIFAPTSTAGYSDPMKAMSIKALEARQKDMMAQSAQQPGITPENTQTPMQGAAHVFNQLGDSMAQGRVMAAAAEQRDRLAYTVAHMDPAHPKGEELGVIGTADPELLKQMLSQLAESRRQAAGFAHQDKSQTAGFAHEDAAQKAGFTHADAAAKLTDDRARELAKITDDRARELAKITDDRARALAEQNNTRARELKQLEIDATARLEKAKTDAATAANAADPKTIVAQKTLEKESAQERALVAELGVAQKDLDAGIFTGRGAGAATIAAQLPIVGEYIGDKEKADRTTHFDNTMNKVATTNMSTILKGSSTDKEMAAFKEMWNSPTATLDQKREAFRRVLQTAKEEQVIGEAALERMGARRLVPGGPAAAVEAKEGAPADPMEGRTATSADGKTRMIRRGGKWEPM